MSGSCSPDTCYNDGSCMHYDRKYICKCKPSYTGFQCEERVVSDVSVATTVTAILIPIILLLLAAVGWYYYKKRKDLRPVESPVLVVRKSKQAIEKDEGDVTPNSCSDRDLDAILKQIKEKHPHAIPSMASVAEDTSYAYDPLQHARLRKIQQQKQQKQAQQQMQMFEKFKAEQSLTMKSSQQQQQQPHTSGQHIINNPVSS